MRMSAGPGAGTGNDVLRPTTPVAGVVTVVLRAGPEKGRAGPTTPGVGADTTGTATGFGPRPQAAQAHALSRHPHARVRAQSQVVRVAAPGITAPGFRHPHPPPASWHGHPPWPPLAGQAKVAQLGTAAGNAANGDGSGAVKAAKTTGGGAPSAGTTQPQ
jgi:hypothetical protein